MSGAGLKGPEKPSLGLVIPTRNAEDALPGLVGALHSDRLDLDAVVSDGGSDDGTLDVAARHGVRITEAEGGRGSQMREGARTALGDWLLFLHADSRLPEGWDDTVAAFIGDPANAGRAGYFRFALDDDTPAARRLERMVAWRCRVLGLPYGDQGLLLARDFLDTLGGVPALPLMEDVTLIRRIGKRRLVALDAPLVTSAEKFRREGYWRRSARNLFCLALYFMGLPSSAIRRVYG